MAYRRIAVRPLTTALGAEVAGLDLSRPLDDNTFAELRRAFLDRQVLFFRDQALTPDQHKAFARRFGPLARDRFVLPMPDHPEILQVVKEADEPDNFGGVWHTDNAFLERPPLGSALYALEVPPVGGDTCFANMYLAYESLSAGLRRLLDGLGAVFSAERCYGPRALAERFADSRAMKIDHGEQALRDSVVERVHPVVRRHPETGRKALFVNSAYTLRFDRMTVEESRPLLDYLYAHAARTEFTCRFRWQAGSFALWDNRCVQHLALNDYAGHRRVMHRVTIEGDRPG